MQNTKLSPAPSKSLTKILAYLAKGGRAFIATYGATQEINQTTVEKFRNAGVELLTEEGDGYRMHKSKSKSIYILPGQLKIVTRA